MVGGISLIWAIPIQSGGGRNNLHMDIPPGLPQVMADRRRIVQVLSNLLSNAARHTHQSSAIRMKRVSASCCGTTGGNRTKGSVGKAHD